MKFALLFILFGTLLSGCAGLNQFPNSSVDYAKDIIELDPNYDDALREISADNITPEKQVKIRNQEIDRRLAVIDSNFKAFQAALAKEDVRADFGIALVQIGVGGAGALVSETASQIMSAVSGGLAGAQQAYDKAALFDKALPALLAQMIASRNTILTIIYKRRILDLDQYPLPAARQDLDAYEFAGSIPGSIVATSADAGVKNVAAVEEIEKNITTFTAVRNKQFVETARQGRVDKMLDAVSTLSGSSVLALANNPPVTNKDANDGVKNMFRSAQSMTEDTARKILKFRIVMSLRDDMHLNAWEAAIAAGK